MLTQQPLQEFLDNLASDTAVPGGGSVAATAGAMAAALVSMVCNLTIGREKYAAVEAQMQETLARSEALRRRLTELVEEDVAAFNAVMNAFKLPKQTEEEKEARRAAIQEGYKQATIVPLETARACAELIRLAKTVIENGNPNAASDGGVAVLCAQAGLKGAALNVLINLSSIKDQAFVSEHQAALDDILAEHDALAHDVYQTLKSGFIGVE